MFTFRASITLTVMTFVVALAALLMRPHTARSLSHATREAASAYMDASSNRVLGRLQATLKPYRRW